MRKLFIVAALLASTSAFAKKKDNRPDAMTIGIGAGMTIPSSPLSIDTGAVRARLSDQLTIEPSITYDSDKSEAKVVAKSGSTSNTAKGTSSATSIGLEALGRYTLADKGPVDLQGLAGLYYGSDKTETDPNTDGDSKNDKSYTSDGTAALVVGVGVESFFKGHYSVSADALSRL